MTFDDLRIGIVKLLKDDDGKYYQEMYGTRYSLFRDENVGHLISRVDKSLLLNDLVFALMCNIDEFLVDLIDDFIQERIGVSDFELDWLTNEALGKHGKHIDVSYEAVRRSCLYSECEDLLDEPYDGDYFFGKIPTN